MLKQFKKDLEGCKTFLSNKVDVNDRCGEDNLYCPICKSNIKAKTEIMKEMKEKLIGLKDFRRPVTDENNLFLFKQRVFINIEKTLNEINTCLKLAEERGFK